MTADRTTEGEVWGWAPAFPDDRRSRLGARAGIRRLARRDRWGGWAPIVFIGIQAMQVIIAPIPGDVTGLLAGFVFGQWLPPAPGHLRAGHGAAGVGPHELPRR